MTHHSDKSRWNPCVSPKCYFYVYCENKGKSPSIPSFQSQNPYFQVHLKADACMVWAKTNMFWKFNVFLDNLWVAFQRESLLTI